MGFCSQPIAFQWNLSLEMKTIVSFSCLKYTSWVSDGPKMSASSWEKTLIKSTKTLSSPLRCYSRVFLNRIYHFSSRILSNNSNSNSSRVRASLRCITLWLVDRKESCLPQWSNNKSKCSFNSSNSKCRCSRTHNSIWLYKWCRFKPCKLCNNNNNSLWIIQTKIALRSNNRCTGMTVGLSHI